MSAVILALVSLAMSPSAQAAGAGYYHPDDVAGASRLFSESAEWAGAAFGRAQDEVSRLGAALSQLELGVGLLGEAAPPALQTWAVDTRKAGLQRYLMVQTFVDHLQDDYTGAFEAALKRALTGLGRTGVVVCQASAPRFGPGGGSSRACEGEDLNAALAKAMDADPELKRSLAEIQSRAWPEVSMPQAPQAVIPLTGDQGYLRADALARALWGDRLDARTEALEDSLAPLEEQLDEGDKDALARSEALKADYLKGLAEDGAALREATSAALGRAAKKGRAPAAVGLCANPAALGGCPGEDVTEATLEVLRADKKLVRALESHASSHPVTP